MSALPPRMSLTRFLVRGQLERLTVESSTLQGRCPEPPRRLTASPPLRKGGIIAADRPVLVPPDEGGARGFLGRALCACASQL